MSQSEINISAPGTSGQHFDNCSGVLASKQHILTLGEPTSTSLLRIN